MTPQTLYYGDCLDWMREWPAGSVDLIYLDPPFNSNANYNILFGAGNGVPAQVRAFQDTWKWDAAAVERTQRIVNAVAHPAQRAVAGLQQILGGSGMLAYVSYLAERLPEMRRLMKPTAAIYLHCFIFAFEFGCQCIASPGSLKLFPLLCYLWIVNL